jgi:hypothetical protein
VPISSIDLLRFGRGKAKSAKGFKGTALRLKFIEKRLDERIKLELIVIRSLGCEALKPIEMMMRFWKRR